MTPKEQIDYLLMIAKGLREDSLKTILRAEAMEEKAADLLLQEHMEAEATHEPA